MTIAQACQCLERFSGPSASGDQKWLSGFWKGSAGCALLPADRLRAQCDSQSAPGRPHGQPPSVSREVPKKSEELQFHLLNKNVKIKYLQYKNVKISMLVWFLRNAGDEYNILIKKKKH
ncbi:MAG: hypothetical protein R6U41_01695 [Desulfosalsimonas sp.]|uniref:hypothetical protein n=1 Tax=Desulfosalsimonas sp. TaxID=3073848 RepID=UPI003970D14C